MATGGGFWVAAGGPHHHAMPPHKSGPALPVSGRVAGGRGGVAPSRGASRPGVPHAVHRRSGGTPEASRTAHTGGDGRTGRGGVLLLVHPDVLRSSGVSERCAQFASGEDPGAHRPLCPRPCRSNPKEKTAEMQLHPPRAPPFVRRVRQLLSSWGR